MQKAMRSNPIHIRRIIDYSMQHEGFFESHSDIANFHKDRNTNRYKLALEECIKVGAVKKIKGGYELISTDEMKHLFKDANYQNIMVKHNKTIFEGKIPKMNKKQSAEFYNIEMPDGRKMGDKMIDEIKRIMKSHKEEDIEEKIKNKYDQKKAQKIPSKLQK